METSHLVGGAVGIGVLGVFWEKIKFVFSKLLSLFIVRIHVEEHAARAICLYCWSKMKRSPFGERRYGASTEYVRSIKRYQKIGYEQIGNDPVIFWDGWKPLVIGQINGENKNNQQLNNNIDQDPITLSFIRFTFDPDALIIEALDVLNNRQEKGKKIKRFTVFRIFGNINGDAIMKTETNKPLIESRFSLGDKRILKWDINNLGPQYVTNTNPFDRLALPPNSLEMIGEIRHWKQSENWYRDRGIPWRRGWLLHGKPGTGKTSLVRAIAEDLDVPIFVFDLSTLCNRSLQEYWQEMFNWIPCIALIEDIDSIFNGRSNIQRTEMNGGLTFDCLLNCMDGVETSNGIFTIVTTNDIDKIDRALADNMGNGLPVRPGRIDRVLELDVLTDDGRRVIAKRILGESNDRIEEIVEKGCGDTGARFTERCSRLALAQYWRQLEPEGEIFLRPEVRLEFYSGGNGGSAKEEPTPPRRRMVN